MIIMISPNLKPIAPPHNTENRLSPLDITETKTTEIASAALNASDAPADPNESYNTTQKSGYYLP